MLKRQYDQMGDFMWNKHPIAKSYSLTCLFLVNIQNMALIVH